MLFFMPISRYSFVVMTQNRIRHTFVLQADIGVIIGGSLSGMKVNISSIHCHFLSSLVIQSEDSCISVI